LIKVQTYAHTGTSGIIGIDPMDLGIAAPFYGLPRTETEDMVSAQSTAWIQCLIRSTISLRTPVHTNRLQ